MKRIKKDVFDLTKTSISLGVGSTVVSSVGGNTSGLSTFSGFLPTMGTVMGAGHTLKMVNKLGKKRKR